MTTAIIGTGGLGSVIARQLAAGGETLRLSSADNESARTLAAQIGHAAVVAASNRDGLQGADAVVLALRFTVLKGVIDEIAAPLAGRLGWPCLCSQRDDRPGPRPAWTGPPRTGTQIRVVRRLCEERRGPRRHPHAQHSATPGNGPRQPLPPACRRHLGAAGQRWPPQPHAPRRSAGRHRRSRRPTAVVLGRPSWCPRRFLRSRAGPQALRASPGRRSRRIQAAPGNH